MALPGLAAPLGLAGLFWLTACSGEPPVLSIASGGSLGNYYSAARAISRVVNKDGEDNGFRLEYVETAGSISNIDSIVSDRTAFGIAQEDIEYQAVKGLGAWKEAGPQTELRAMFTLYTEAITVVATADSGIFEMRDLIGRRVDIGHPDSGGRRNAEDALDVLGSEWRSGITVLGASPDDRSAMYLRGEIDAFITTVGHPATDVGFAVSSVPGARLVPLDDLAGLLERHPYYSRTVIPIESYTGVRNEADVETAGVKTVFLTSAEVPDEVVYAITRAVFENVGALAEFDPVLEGLSKREMAEGSAAPLHPGSARYFAEAGLRPAQ